MYQINNKIRTSKWVRFNKKLLGKALKRLGNLESKAERIWQSHLWNLFISSQTKTFKILNIKACLSRIKKVWAMLEENLGFTWKSWALKIIKSRWSKEVHTSINLTKNHLLRIKAEEMAHQIRWAIKFRHLELETSFNSKL